MDFMPLFSCLILALVIATLPTAILGGICAHYNVFRYAKAEQRGTMMLSAWAVFAIVIFTAMNSQELFWK